MTRNKLTKKGKRLKNKVRKIKKKKYRTFLDHLGVQPIPSTLSFSRECSLPQVSVLPLYLQGSILSLKSVGGRFTKFWPHMTFKNVFPAMHYVYLPKRINDSLSCNN
jgi:hypothetical protein